MKRMLKFVYAIIALIVLTTVFADNTIVYLSNTTNALGADASGAVPSSSTYLQKISYENIFGFSYSPLGGSEYVLADNVVVRLSSPTNGFFQVSDYPTPYATTIAFGDLLCTYKTNADCNEAIDEKFIMSLSNRTNAFASTQNIYPIKVCCKSPQAEAERPGVSICGVEYLCGQTDGVCPKDFLTEDGNYVSCGNYTDPDC